MEIAILVDLVQSNMTVFILAIGRPFGLTITFIAFSWFKINSGILRMGIAISLALPVFAFSGSEISFAIENNEISLFLLVIKEVMIGAIIGWLISLPLLVGAGAGAIIDTYRGNFEGAVNPTGGQITAFAHLFMITSFGLFASIGGFWIITDLLYQSYATWPIHSPIPDIKAGFDVFFSLLADLVKAAFLLAAPIITVMFISDMTFLLSSKIGKKINITFLAFSTKSIIAISLLPIFMFVFLRVQETNFEQFNVVNSFLKALQ